MNAPEAPAQEAPTMDRLCQVYKRIDAQISAITKKHEEELAPLKEQKDLIASAIKDRMLIVGAKSVKTDHGTAILSIETRYYAQDWEQFRTYCAENSLYDLFEKRIAQRNMSTYVEENGGVLPPGCASSSEYKVSVRKPTK